MNHLILFDDTCRFCWNSVNRIRKWDKKGHFFISPIGGDLAKKVLKGKYEQFKNADTLVLVEDFEKTPIKIWIKGRGAMRIFWLLGGWRKLVGWLAFIPIVDLFYTFIAKRRHRL